MDVLLIPGQAVFAQPTDHINSNLRLRVVNRSKKSLTISARYHFLVSFLNYKKADPHDREAGTEGIKMLYYNKAYIIYHCLSWQMVSHHLLPPRAYDKDGLALTKPSSNKRKALEIATQYYALMLKNGEKEMGCELKSRLLDAEIEFPPFEFLKMLNGRDELYGLCSNELLLRCR